SSSIIDRVVQKLSRKLLEVPVGFKWFAPGLFDGSCCFGGEESAGASFLRRNGSVWTTDKDGPIMCLLAAEITARTGKDPGEHYRAMTAEFGTPFYTRIDAAAIPEEKTKLLNLSPEAVKDATLAGEPITGKLTRAPGNNAAIGGLKVTATSGWFAARPSGTENIYKIYAESFTSQAHLNEIVSEAQAMVNRARQTALECSSSFRQPWVNERGPRAIPQPLPVDSPSAVPHSPRGGSSRRATCGFHRAWDIASRTCSGGLRNNPQAPSLPFP